MTTKPSTNPYASPTFQPIGYDADNRCRACGEHLSNPHGTGCPAEAAAQLRQEADHADQAHADTVAACGYSSGASPALTMGDEPTEISHRLLATAQRLAADLIEADHADALNLDTWLAATELVAYLTGGADPWSA